MAFNEDTRVKLPCLLHLHRLGYDYLSLEDAIWDTSTNIFPALFSAALERINPGLEPGTAERLLADIRLELDNEDLGEAFHKRLIDQSNIRLIDFEDFDNNSFHVVTELPCINRNEEFRPDITLLINGLPLVFIEVKKPNNRDGIIAERDRIRRRSENPLFRRFINLTRLMVFSNNMEYDDGDPEPIQGAFYATPAYGRHSFNYFREEENPAADGLLRNLEEDVLIRVLRDNNHTALRHDPAFATNLEPGTPTNRLCTSLFSRQRLAFWLRYAIVHVRPEGASIQQHVMRYPQFFATHAIAHKLDAGIRKGIIWHTQGSGKTALAFYNVRFLADWYQKRGTISKFYFIVDRIDLLEQAMREFRMRGLKVHTIDSREDFIKDIKSAVAIHNDKGQLEITVVNIQRFADDPAVTASKDYNTSIQRVYFLDEVHRSYNPAGSFLANLEQSDRDAIRIGLTGTPLLHDDESRRSTSLFGDYIHKYYYNASIADGYTLRLIREDIRTDYHLQLQQALESLKLKQGSLDTKALYAHPRFVGPMLDYILEDFTHSRIALGDSSIGGMVICSSSEQAREMYRQWQDRQAAIPGATNRHPDLPLAADDNGPFPHSQRQKNQPKTAALILHDEGTKDERKDKVEAFKAGKIDLLFVYNMLLTGFDAPRLKKLYLGRVIKAHSLLQALTRVNRTYGRHRYGYVVDFANISEEFDRTNQRYLKELKVELGDEMDSYSNLFKSPAEIDAEIVGIKNALFQFDIANAEEFSRQVSQISDRQQLLTLKKALASARELYNLLRLSGQYDRLNDLDFRLLGSLYSEVDNHLALLNLKRSMEEAESTAGLLNAALEDTLFLFTKVGEAELKLADDLKDTLRRTREALGGNFDPQDPVFITLKEELERLFKNRNLNAVTQQDMQTNMQALEAIHDKATRLNLQNERLRHKYKGDAKFARIHKRLKESGNLDPADDSQIFDSLFGVKQRIDDQVLHMQQLLGNSSYFEQEALRTTAGLFGQPPLPAISAATIKQINQLIVAEYLREYRPA